MRYLRQYGNNNILVGIFLLVLLGIFAGQGTIQNLLPSVIPFAYESIPCSWLRSGVNRAEHQSLIGRNSQDPLQIRVRTSTFPRQPGESLSISVILTNRSIGTVAIFYNADQVQFGDAGNSGLGIIPNSGGNIQLGAGGAGSVPEGDIRLLGPRQSCVHTETFTFEQIPQLGLSAGTNSVLAYYRNTFRGNTQITQPGSQIIYADQGLWVGVVESELVQIPFATS
jgi:hypothetical protein